MKVSQIGFTNSLGGRLELSMVVEPGFLFRSQACGRGGSIDVIGSPTTDNSNQFIIFYTFFRYSDHVWMMKSDSSMHKVDIR